ncbi:MAG: A/G-specific adenine glycosylase [Bacillota bacterium]
MENNEKKQFATHLLLWYDNCKADRNLPWRNTKNPYFIWVSEIMSQQTRVETVKSYYERFIKLLPTVEDLAKVDEDILLKLWEGLGYYSRARNLQKAAKELMERHGGALPADYEALKKLSGIGTYTAGAIASIAFSLPYGAVDGNVLRVMTRVTGDTSDIALEQTKKAWTEEILRYLPPDHAGEFNQALMELGATVCIPNGVPRCFSCPISSFCYAYQQELTDQLPVKSKKKPRTKVYMNVFFIVHDNQIAIEKRTEKGVLKGLFQLPNTTSDVNPLEALQDFGIFGADIKKMTLQKHIFTHIEWHMEGYFIQCHDVNENNFVWKTMETIQNEYALPSAFKKIWTEGCNFSRNTENI